MKRIIIFTLLGSLSLSGCGTGSSESNSTKAINDLINIGCENLPNIYKRMQDTRPASVPGKISRDSFGELARLDIKYLAVSAAFQKVDDMLEPIIDAYEEVQIVNGFCSGIGTLTP
jgi:hypothetical protein